MSTLAPPLPAANPYPHRGPNASRMNPAAVAPRATPTPIPVDSHDMASVVGPGSACDSSRLYPAISVGAIVSPHR